MYNNLPENAFNLRKINKYSKYFTEMNKLEKKSATFNFYNNQITDENAQVILLTKRNEQSLIYLLNLAKTTLLIQILLNKDNFEFFKTSFEEFINLKEEYNDMVEEDVLDVKKNFNMNYSEDDPNKKRISYENRDKQARKDFKIIDKEIQKLDKMFTEEKYTEANFIKSTEKLIYAFNKLNPTNVLIKILLKRIPENFYDEKTSIKLKMNQNIMSQIINLLVKFNMRLIISYAKKYITRIKNHLDFDDVKNEGLIGFVNAMYKFELDSKLKISTYATWWIRQSVIQYITDNKNLIRIPLYYTKIISNYNRFIEEIESNKPKLKDKLSDINWIAEQLEISTKKLESALHFTKNSKVVSLNQKNDDNEDFSLEDVVINEDIDMMEDTMNDELKFMIKKAIDKLNEKEKLIIMERHELFNDQPKTLEELGKKLNLTKERIRQIEVEAFKKIQVMLADYIEKY